MVLVRPLHLALLTWSTPLVSLVLQHALLLLLEHARLPSQVLPLRALLLSQATTLATLFTLQVAALVAM